MNMNFQRPHGFELKHSALPVSKSSADEPRTGNRWTKYVGFSLLLAGALFLAANAGTSILLVIGGAIVALVALAAFVCICAQNETPYW
jgi:hypothetical protein